MIRNFIKEYEQQNHISTKWGEALVGFADANHPYILNLSPSGALTLDEYDRHKCYVVLRKNAELYTDFGSSYTDESGNQPNSVGSEVCGKCIVNTPCTFFCRKPL